MKKRIRKQTLEKCCTVLGLATSAEWDEISTRYKSLIRQCHPDRFTIEDPRREVAEEQSKTVNQAFQRLRTGHEDGSLEALQVRASTAASARPVSFLADRANRRVVVPQRENNFAFNSALRFVADPNGKTRR